MQVSGLANVGSEPELYTSIYIDNPAQINIYFIQGQKSHRRIGTFIVAPVVPISLSMVAQPLMPPPFRKKNSHHQSKASSGHKKTLATARFCWVQSEFCTKTLVSFCCHLKKMNETSTLFVTKSSDRLGYSVNSEACTSSQHIYIQLPSGDFTSPWNP